MRSIISCGAGSATLISKLAETHPAPGPADTPDKKEQRKE
jgi:hypothetical protein